MIEFNTRTPKHQARTLHNTSGVDNDDQGLMKQLEALFNPRSVAVVGVPRGMKTGKLFLIGLLGVCRTISLDNDNTFPRVYKSLS